MSARVVYHVAPFHNGWQVTETGEDGQEAVVDTKERAIELAKEQAAPHELAQVVVHKKDGTIEEEFTHGNDPRNIPG